MIPEIIHPEWRKLFVPGNMVHVSRLGIIEHVLDAGLASPLVQARRAGKQIKESTLWHPNENKFVKFLFFESPNHDENFHALHDHFETFGDFGSEDPTSYSIGFLVKNLEALGAIRLWENEPYFGIENYVHPLFIRGLVLPFIPLLRMDVEHLKISRNRYLKNRAFSAAVAAHDRGGIDSPFTIFDHFGRTLLTL